MSLHSSPVAYWTPSNLGGSSSGVISFCLFTLLMGLSRQEYWSGFLFPPPVEMELLKFPAYNIVLNFFGKKKEMGAKKKILSYCSPQSLHPPFPRVCESFFPDIYKIVNGQALSYTQVVCACSSSPFFNNKRGCTPLQICSLFCVFLWLLYFSVYLIELGHSLFSFLICKGSLHSKEIILLSCVLPLTLCCWFGWELRFRADRKKKIIGNFWRKDRKWS